MSLDAVSQISLMAEVKALRLLEDKLQQEQKAIQSWFKIQWQKTPPPLYGSVDMRNAGFKVAPVDMNLFPAGFNNLNPDFLKDVIVAAHAAIAELAPQTKRIVLVPESHSRNLFYWENVFVLLTILKRAGFDARIGSVSDEVAAPQTLDLPSGNQLLIEPLQREGNLLKVADFEPEVILLNNDLSDGIPQLLVNVSQPILPPAALGWHQRLKSEHFQYYAEVSRDFGDLLGMDSWLMTPLFRQCGEIDFLDRSGMDCLIEHTQKLLTDIQSKYDEYGVTQQPFVMVKADAGTHGMAVMTVRNIDELAQLNRKQRTSMAKSKGGIPVRRVIAQEGIYTLERFGPSAYVAEPVVYLWGKQVAGGFYRIHQDRGPDENLNSPGMHFESLPFAWSCSCLPDEEIHPYQKHLYSYGVIAQLSMLAAAREIHQLGA